MDETWVTPQEERIPMSDDNAINQSDIEKLLAAQSGQSAPPEALKPPEPEAASLNSAIDQSDIEKLLAGAGGGSTANHADKAPTVAPAVAPDIPAATKPPPPPPGDAGNPADQSDIESLLKGSLGASPPQPKAGPGIGVPQSAQDDVIDSGVPQGDIDYLLRRAEEALESITSGNGNLSGAPPEIIEFQFPEFGGSTPNSEHATLDQISEVELDIKIELGRTNMYLEDILKLRKGSVVALDKIAGDAVDIYVNERLIARGEVLVLNDNFCVRVAELLAGAIPIE
jgi:flagellar motor switch protein FliN/FliY